MSPSDPSTRTQKASVHAPDRGRMVPASDLSPAEQEAVLEHLPVAVYRVDATAPHNMTYVQGALENILGHSRTEWISQPQAWKEAVHEEDRPRCLRKLIFALAAGVPQEWQHRFTHRNGRTVWVKHRIQPVSESPDLPYSAVMGSFEDVTAERLTAGQTLKTKSASTPSHSQGLARLAGGIAHDFNNALTAVLGNAQLLLRDYEDEDPNRKSILEIISSGERAAELTQELLSFSRTKTQPAVIIDLNDLLESMKPLILEELAAGQQLVMDLARAPILISGHRDMLEKMIVRLVENSRDAMPGNGVLTLQTRCVLPTTEAGLPERCPKDQPLACLTISDTGSGILEKDQPYIFDPFYSTHTDPQYRGLGLSLALHTIELHHGFIESHSGPEQGTAMQIYLPWKEKKQDASGSTTPIPTGSETLLLVEDDLSVRTTTERILNSLEYTVLTAKDASEALRLIQQDTVQIDLALLDIFMPDMDGFTLGRKLREQKPDLQTLYISGYAQEALKDDDLACENTNFVSKPYTREKLARALRRILDLPSE